MGDLTTAQEPSWPERGRAAREALRETWESTAEVCHGLVTNEWELPTGCPGWSVKDQLSHVIGIERLLLGEPAPPWDDPLGDHVKNAFAATLEPWVAVRRSEVGDDVLAEFRQVTARRLIECDKVTAEAWSTVSATPLGTMPFAAFMELRVYDCWVHEQDVRRALDRPGGCGGGASRISLDRVQSAMPKVVAKLAAAPDGTVACFRITGAADDARQFSLAVDAGRAAPVENDMSPTVALTMSSLEFVRLGCGRITSEEAEAAGGIGIGGDAALAQKILSHMNFMF